MLAWIGSAMNLTAQLALGGIFWFLALLTVAVIVGLIAAMIAKAINQ